MDHQYKLAHAQAIHTRNADNALKFEFENLDLKSEQDLSFLDGVAFALTLISVIRAAWYQKFDFL